MRARCPWCGEELDLAQVFHEQNLRAVIRLLPVFGEHHRLAWEYCELFGVSPLARKSAKLRRVLEELARMWQAGQFSFNRRVYSISRSGMAAALRAVAGRRFEGKLKNHNYLKQVMITIAEKEERERSRRAEAELRAREQAARRRRHEEQPSPLPPQVRELIKKIGAQT